MDKILQLQTNKILQTYLSGRLKLMLIIYILKWNINKNYCLHFTIKILVITRSYTYLYGKRLYKTCIYNLLAVFYILLLHNTLLYITYSIIYYILLLYNTF